MKKYVREILIGILSILLIIAIVLLVQQKKRTDELVETINLATIQNTKQIEENKRILAANQVILDSLMEVVAENDNTIILDKQEYEKTKKSPARTNYTDKQLVNWLNSYRSNNKRR